MSACRSVGLAALVSLALPITCSSGDHPVGGRYFLCGLFQVVKYGSLVTGQVEGVVVGAIGSGLACGFGW
jgi:hypothetical protein